MSQQQEDLDGIEKNLDKFKKEWIKVKEALKPEVVRFLKRPWDTHTYVNLFVEARRASPYLIGHVDAVLYLILICIIVFK